MDFQIIVIFNTLFSLFTFKISVQLKKFPRNMQMQALTNEITGLNKSIKQINFLDQQQYPTVIKPIELLEPAKMGWQNSQEVQQFNKLYINRLEKFSNKFPGLNAVIPLSKIDTQSQTGKIAVIGIVKRLQARRVRAFDKQYDEVMGDSAYNNSTSRIVQPLLYSEQDDMEIQDKTGKVKFILAQKATMDGKPITQMNLPHGVVLGLQGKFSKKQNKLIVQQLFLPQIQNEQNMWVRNDSQWKYMVVSQPTIQTLQTILRSFQYGLNNMDKIQSLIIVGGLNVFRKETTPDFIKKFDSIVDELRNLVYIYVMQTSMQARVYPLDPYHKLLFPKSHSQIYSASNPQSFKEKQSNIEFTITGCQSIKDFQRNAQIDEVQSEPSNKDIKTMENLLKFNHLCPTSPFSLKCKLYPQDYLALDHFPNVFIGCGCNIFDSRIMKFKSQTVQLVTIPINASIIINFDKKAENSELFQIQLLSFIEQTSETSTMQLQ